MSKIVPKLNLNKTPQLVDNNSLIMAKNIRLLDDGTIGPDTSLNQIDTSTGNIEKYDKNFTVLSPYYSDIVARGIQDEIDTIKYIIKEQNGISEDGYVVYFEFNDYYYSSDIYFLNKIGMYNGSAYAYTLPYYDIDNKQYDKDEFYLEDSGDLSNNTYKYRICINENGDLDDFYYIKVPREYDDYELIEINGAHYNVFNPVLVITYNPATTVSNITKYISQIVGLDNKIYFIKEDESSTLSNLYDRIKIFEYDEINSTYHIISCSWKYSGGKINGCVTVNNRGDKILTINEYGVENKNIPIKYINLNTCRIDDDESIYTQSPKLPITNLLLSGYYVKTIPLGVYQFFIRYKISDYNYTQWLPCSGELPIGNDYRLPTIQGTVKYVDFHEQSQYSFVFTVQHLFEDYKNIYKAFQLGFIVSSEGGIFARSWKHFNMSTSKIYFGINTNEIEDINIDDLLKVNYELFNVENIAFFKNKLYISNYKETDFNEDLSYYSKDINVDFKIEKIPFEISESLYLNDRKIQYETDGVNNKIIINKIEDEPINITFNDTSIIKKDYTNSGSPTGIQPLPFYYVSDHLGPQLGSHPDYREFIPTSHTYNLLPQPGSTIVGSLGQTHINSDIFKKYIDKSIINKVWLVIKYPNDGTSTEEHVYLFGSFNNTTSNFIDTSNPNKYIKVNTTEESIINQEAVARLINNIRSYIVNYSGSIQDIQINKSTFKYLLNDSSYDDKIKNATSIKFYYTYSKCVNEVLFTGRVLNEGSGRTTYTDYNGFAFRRIDNKVEIRFDFVGNIRNPQEGEFDVNLRKSLLPFTKYDFYVHYLKDNGIVTNGNYIGSKELDYYNDGYYTIDKTNWATADISSGSFSSLTINNITYTREGSGTAADPYVYKTNNSILTNNKEVRYYNPSDSTQYLILSLRPANTNSYIYPIFSNIKRPGGYVACFISIYKSGNDVAEIFNIVSQSTEEEDPTYSFKGDCIEVDALLYPVIANLDIKNHLGDVTYERKGKYIPSSSVNPVQIGKVGKIQCNTGSTNPQDTRYWLILNNSHEQSNEQKELTKVTPYIVLSDSPVQYTNYENLNLPGTLSKVVKPNNVYADKYYVNGGTVYKSDSSYTPQPSDPTNIIQFEKVTSHINLIGSYVTEYVHSNFNLDCVSLRNDINQYLIDIENSGKSQLVYAIDSDLISLLYELKSIYIDYTKKLYRITANNNKTVFNNTIRCSNNNVDEYIENIYLFDATDYYNIPSNRGIITNLVSIANTLYVHCEHTLYRFTDNKELNSNNEEITLQETDIFNSGITEMFDAKYGYAGLKKREHSLVTYNAYIFYDEYVKTIYYFDGQNKLSIISQPIKKILSNIDIIDVKFVADEQHNRFFTNILIDTIVSGSHVTKNLCLSFNFNAQSFVSIHDINFVEGFHTRSNTYFIAEKYTSDVLTNRYVYKIVDYVLNSQNVAQYVSYANCYKKSIIEVSDCDTIGNNNPINSCIDVVVNTEYEKVKQLDYVNWICSEISQYGFNNNLVSEETNSKIYPGHKIRIYSDITNTELVSLVDNNGYAIISNDKALDNPNSWKNIRYNCGIWSMNYFRDISHRTDIFNYNENVPLSNSRNLHQEDSLIYGKYFIIRFIFTNRNFKIENIILKMNDYGKTK